MYSVALLHLKLHSLSFLTVFSEVFRVFSLYFITSSANSDSFTFSFPSWMPFISCSCLIALVSTFNTVLNKIVKSEHPCLDLRRKVVRFFTLEYVIYRLIIHGLYYVEVHSLYTCFVDRFVFLLIINGC